MEVKIVKTCFFVLLALGIGLPFCVGTFTFADAARGVEVLQQFLEGGKFNQLVYPSPSAPYASYFVSWWAPGQWLVLYLLHLLGLESLQIQQAILILLCSGISLFGFYRLFHFLGYTTEVVWWSLLLILGNQAFYWHFFMYYGGDLLLLAVFPYFIYFLLMVREQKPLVQALQLFLLCSLGLFAKSTFVLFLVAGGLFVLHRTIFRPAKGGKWTFLVVFSVVSLSFILVYQLFFLANGSTPGSAVDLEGYQGVPNTWLGDFSFPLGAVTGIFLRISFIIYKASFLHGVASWLQLMPMDLFLLLLWNQSRKPPARDRDVLLFFVVPVLLMFVGLFLLNRAVSYEMRHFALFSFLVTPMLVLWVKERLRTQLATIALGLLLIADLAMGVNSFLDFQSGSSLIKGIKVELKDVPLMKSLDEWDRSHSDALCIIEDYWFPSLAVRKNDKLVLTCKNSHCFIVSGMEIPNPDSLNSSILRKYDDKKVLLVLKKEQTQFFALFPEHRFSLKQRIGAFFVFEGIGA